MFGYADELSEVTGYSDQVETTPSMNGLGKFIKEKVIRDEEIILRGRMPALSLYGDRTYTYISPSGTCWLDWKKIVIDTFGSWGIYRGGQVCCLHLHAAKYVMKSELSKRCLVHRLTRR